MSFKTEPKPIEISKACFELWTRINLHGIWETNKSKMFILHDGPPYANGDIHLGHAVNKIIKDTMNRFMHFKGFGINYIMGWDCNGLPIEAKVESDFRSKGLKISQIGLNEFLNKCFEFASHWIQVQKSSFEKLGIIANEKYYTTIQLKNQLKIVETFHKFVKKGLVFRGLRPTIWSCEEQTALADAEIQYLDKESNAIDVAMSISYSDIPELQKNAYIVIWTTTPWTIPANRAIALREDFEYSIINSDTRTFVVASKLLHDFLNRSQINENYKLISEIKGSDLLHTKYLHPLYKEGFKFESNLYHSSHVTDDQGTGFVHIAPDHGIDDFNICKQKNISCTNYILDNGFFREDLPHFLANRFFSDAESDIISLLNETGLILSAAKIKHQYPHSWRSCRPIIYRATDQWFIDIENPNENLKERALDAAEQIDWFSRASKERFVSTLKCRNSWCVSRQRLWGTPMCVFYDKKTGEVLNDEAIFARTMKYLERNGISAWWEDRASDEILGKLSQEYTKEKAIVDVWFESGCTQFFLEDLPYPADMRVEGSDQHRAWFQSSILIACIDSVQVPSKRIKTHGYVVDKDGYKMSKSKGNGMEPVKVAEKYGPDVLRLLILRQDTSNDITWNENHAIESKKIEHRLRNTIKFLIENKSKEDDSIIYSDYDQLHILEKWLLHRIYELQASANKIDEKWDFHLFIKTIYSFCDRDLSGLYFDIRKDTIYWEDRLSQNRTNVRLCLGIVLNYLLRWLAPIIPFGTEEAWQTLGNNTSIHAQTFLETPEIWKNEKVKTQVEYLFSIKKVANAQMEKLREQNAIKSTFDAQLHIKHPPEAIFEEPEIEGILRMICMVSKVELERSDKLEITEKPAEGYKCKDCKRIVSQVSEQMCSRCKTLKRCIKCERVVFEIEDELCMRCKTKESNQVTEINI